MLPDWIPADAWAGYVEMRKKQKKPLTDRATELVIKKLDEFRIKGHDVGAILDRSTENSWQGVFEPDRKSQGKNGVQNLGKSGQATANNAQEWIEEAQESEIAVKTRFAQLFTILADYYKSEVSRAMLLVYWEGLRQYDYEAIEKAAWAHTQSPDEAGRWMPKISDLTKVLQGRTVDQASIAWAKVDRAIRTVGTWQDVAFDDPLIHRVIQDIGGWIKLGQQDEKEWPFIEKRFVTAYQGYRMKSDMPDYPDRLIGMANAHNGVEGQNKQPVRLIGDAEKAKAVLLAGSGNVKTMNHVSNSIKQLEK